MSLAISSRSGVRRIPFSELQICGCCLNNGDEPLLECGKCSVRVHAHCYLPNREVNPSTWLCEPCATLNPNERETVICAICQMPGGALKPTDEDDCWAHVCCAYWTPETYFKGDTILGVTDIVSSRRGLRCIFCKKREGCVQCSFGKCTTSFHLMCACQHGLQLSLEHEGDSLNPKSICHRHKQVTRKLKGSTAPRAINVREEDAICDVCGHESAFDSNDIVICDGCDVAVHQNCYGVQSIPESQWFCQACSADRPGKCILCADTDGAVKQTTNGDWVHVVCALWSNQAVFLKPSSLEAVTGIDRLLLDDPDRLCQFCGDAVGFCCDCAYTGCNTFFHIRCARKNKQRIEIYDLNNPTNALSTLPRLESVESQARLSFVLYCNDHQSVPFSPDDYQRDHPFPCLDNCSSDVDTARESPDTMSPSFKQRKRRTSAKTTTEPFAGDGKRSQAEIFWQDEVQPYFDQPRLSALRLSKDRDADMSFLIPPLGKVRSTSFHSFLPSFKSCDWICEQLDIPCVTARRLYALLALNKDAVFTNLHQDGNFINFYFVDTSMSDGDLLQDLLNCQRGLASQIRELDSLRGLLRSKIEKLPPDCPSNHRDVTALHKDYVDMSHNQVIRLSLVAGFRDLDLSASDFTQEHFNTTCRVCFGTEGTEVNPIVICESCGLAVHKYCYGIEVIPEGDWLCDACSGICRPPSSGECALCPLNGFAFKSSDLDDQTVHLVCALWCPQVKILDLLKMAPITNISAALAPAHLTCDICLQNRGATISCSHADCSKRFHVTCAWEYGLFMKVKSVGGKPLFNSFCVPHTPEDVGGLTRDRLKQHELRLKARTQKPTSPISVPEIPVDSGTSPSSLSAVPRVLDGEDAYLADVCAVCFSSLPDELVKCVNCFIAVHRHCYGVEDDLTEFRCIRCTAQPQRARKISCVYCPRLGGAYERHESSRWRHKVCERWASIFRCNGERLFQHVICAICDRKEGSCIQCTSPGCTSRFHSLCGIFVGCELRCEDDQFTALCPLHTPIHVDSARTKDGAPDLFVFYDRLRLVRADMDELRTIMDLVKRREKIKRNLYLARFEMASEIATIQNVQNCKMAEKDVQSEALLSDHESVGDDQGLIAEDEFEEAKLDAEILTPIPRGNPMILNEEFLPHDADLDPTLIDTVDGSVLVEERPNRLQEYRGYAAADGQSSLSSRRLHFDNFDVVEESRQEMEHFHLSHSSKSAAPPTLSAATHGGGSTAEATAAPESASNEVESMPLRAEEADRPNGSGHAGDHGDDEDSDNEKKPGDSHLPVDPPRRRRKMVSSDNEDEEEGDPVSRPLTAVHRRRINRFAEQIRIKIDRSQLPSSTKVKIKKALLNGNSRRASLTNLGGPRRKRRSVGTKLKKTNTSSDDDEENPAIDHSESETEPLSRSRSRRSLRSHSGSELDDFASDFNTPSRRHTERTASLAERRAKALEDAPESIGLNRTRWFPDEINYLHGIVADIDTDPDWDTVAKMMEDKFGATFRVYTKNVVQTRWMRSTSSFPRKASIAPLTAEPTSQRTRWPAEELEYLRSIVSNEEGKRNWPEIARLMTRKFGHKYRTYTTQILQSKVHRLLNPPPEPAEPKEPLRKSAVKPSSRSKWANEELEYLRGLVAKFGTDDWIEIADLMEKFLGERHRTYTGPILQKKWRELGPRGQAGPSQEIRDDMITNPVQHPSSAIPPHDEEAESDANDRDHSFSEEDIEEAVSDRDLRSGSESDQNASFIEEPISEKSEPVTDVNPEMEMADSDSNPKSAEAVALPISPKQSSDKDADKDADPVPAGESADSAEKKVHASPVRVDSSIDESKAMETTKNSPPPIGTPVASVTKPCSVTESARTSLEKQAQFVLDDRPIDQDRGLLEPAEEHGEATLTESNVLKEQSDNTKMEIDNVAGHVELRSPLAHPALPPLPPPPISEIPEQRDAPPGNIAPQHDIAHDAEEPFEEVPWHLEPEEDDELLRTPIQQPPLLFAPSTGDSLFQNPIPAYIMAQGERTSLNTPKPKGNAWRTDEIEYLNELCANPSFNKDWELIAQKLSDKFGTIYRNKYNAASIKARWCKANPSRRTSTAAPTPSRSMAPVKEQRRSASVKEPRRTQGIHDVIEEQSTNKEEPESISRTPYNKEELAYLAELVEQFGSKDWSRVAQRMQFRFNDKYRRYAAMSLSMKWTRLRTSKKNQPPDSDLAADQTIHEAIPQSVAAGFSSECATEKSEPGPEIDQEMRAEPSSADVEPLLESASVQLTPDVQESREDALEELQFVPPSEPEVPESVLEVEPEPERIPDEELEPEADVERKPEEVPELESTPQLPVKTPVMSGRKGRLPYADEERAYFHELFREHGNNWNLCVKKMQGKFGSNYRSYTAASLQARWSKVEQHEQDKFPSSSATDSETAAVDSSETAPHDQQTSCIDSVTLVQKKACEVAETAKELFVPSDEIPVPTGDESKPVSESENEPGQNYRQEPEAEFATIDKGASQDRIGKVDHISESQEPLNNEARTRRRRTQIEPELILSSRTRSAAPVPPPKSISDVESVTRQSPLRGSKPQAEPVKTPKRSRRSIEQKNIPEEVSEQHPEESETVRKKALTPAPPSTVRRGVKAPWFEDELQFLRESAQKAKFEWNDVADLMTEKYGTERRSAGYTPVSVMTIYRRKFPNDRAPATIRVRPSAEEPTPGGRGKAAEPKKRARSAHTGDVAAASTETASHHADSEPEIMLPPTLIPDQDPEVDLPSPKLALSSTRARRSRSPAPPSPKRQSIGNETADLIEKFAAAVESEPEPATVPAPRRRRRTEIIPLVTPKRRKRSIVPGTEPRKPITVKAKIPNQNINRLDRLIGNIQENHFPADQRAKALKFLRAHQSKWRQQRALAVGDKAYVLDSWQFKPYEVKITQVLESGERYRIHYSNWSSKFDEDLPGEFIFRDSPEIRQVRAMADTYSKAR